MYRDASQFKIANALIQDNASEERDDREGEPTTEDWREKILLNANPNLYRLFDNDHQVLSLNILNY